MRLRYPEGMKFLLKWLLAACALLLVAYLYPGVQVQNFGSALIAAAVVGVFYTLLRPFECAARRLLGTDIKTTLLYTQITNTALQKVKSPLDSITDWSTVPEVAELLRIPIGKVRRLIEDHSLIAVRRDGVVKIPTELIVKGEPLASLRGTVLVLLDAGFGLDAAIDWLYTTEESLGITPMAALLAGRKAEIRRLAQSLAL